MTTDKKTFSERRVAVETASSFLRDALATVTAEVAAMRAAEARVTARNARGDNTKRHG
jgi:hypothetical protein